jgi:predicted HicB family RNase H-like nuclease
MPKKKRRRKRKEGRLNLLIDPELKNWVKEHAACAETSVSALVTTFFVKLREKEEGVGIEQI